jgi:hypothetical protein
VKSGELPGGLQAQENLFEPPEEPQAEVDSEPFEEEKHETNFSGFFSPQQGHPSASFPSFSF